MDCDFQLPQKVADQLETMMEGTKQSGPDNNALRSFLITNATAPDGPIVFASPDFVKLTGYAMHSILGHNCRFLQGPDTDRKEVRNFMNMPTSPELQHDPEGSIMSRCDDDAHTIQHR